MTHPIWAQTRCDTETRPIVLSVIDAQSQLQNHLAAVLGDMYGLSLNDLLILLHLDQSVGGRLRRAELAERLARDGAQVLTQWVTALFGGHQPQQALETTARLLDRLTSNLPGKLSA